MRIYAIYLAREEGKHAYFSNVHEQATLASSYLSERRQLVMLKRRITHFTAPFLILALLTLMTGTSMLLSGLSLSGRSSQHSLVRYGATTPIQHIVFLIKENRTFDSYFGAFPGVNGPTTGKIRVKNSVSTIALNHLADSVLNYCHEWDCAHSAYDQG